MPIYVNDICENTLIEIGSCVGKIATGGSTGEIKEFEALSTTFGWQRHNYLLPFSCQSCRSCQSLYMESLLHVTILSITCDWLKENTTVYTKKIKRDKWMN